MTAYYNEIEPYAAQWLRNLIDAGHIAPGYVDERSIEDVYPSDLRGFTQCHFFAGIGGWSYALRLAGWGDDRPVWTGSCPCQPFSAAGKGLGFADERHLWPAWFHLVKECKPPVVFGEQVASKDADPWIDLVQGDLEALDYAFGAIPFPSAGVGAPHIRDRIYWMADSMRGRARNHAGKGVAEEAALDRRNGGLSRQRLRTGFEGSLDFLAEDDRQRFDREQVCVQPRRPLQDCAEASRGRGTGLLGNAGNEGLSQRIGVNGMAGEPTRADAWQAAQRAGIHAIAGPGPVNGFWRDADWLLCRDGRWRPVEPGYEQMVDGSAGSLGRVRASDIEEIQEEVNAWAIRHQADAGEALRRVRLDLRAQALCEREVGRFSGVQSPAVLLAFLRQLTEQGWRFADALACEGAAAPPIVVRVLRFDPSAARTPLRRELAEQLAGELADPMQELPSILAHHAAKCWGDACREKAGAASFPLAHNAPARVGRLRAYGNAINPIQAAVWVSTCMEAA